MAERERFPESPYAVLDPDNRWSPGSKLSEGLTIDQLVPPLVGKLRREVKAFRESGYAGATQTSKSLLTWWFETEHVQPAADGTQHEFRYYFAQREAVETIVWLVDVKRVQDKHDMMRFDSTGAVSGGMFDEDWRRFVVKMATGAGKSKVMSLVLAWSYFHRLYEEGSDLAQNFLVIAPNIIVLDRLYQDFKGLTIFYEDPVLPENGYEGCNWRDDFQLTLHRQDDVHVMQPSGNIFLTNIHRVYDRDETEPSPDDENTMDYFLGAKPTGATTDSQVNLRDIVRDIDELMVLNDEAHHVHRKDLAWFKSIEDIHNQLKQKGGKLALQVDVSATPKDEGGRIFVQTVADYPLVEAIRQKVVKQPVLPDLESRAKLKERQTTRFSEQYADFIDLGVIEWRKAYEQHQKLGKKAVLFVMVDDTKNCDEVAEYLAKYPDLQGAILTIHTKNNGEISEAASGKKKDELEKLRKQAREIDRADNPYKAIVSVLMLKEGWDVRNVTTVVGLRSFTSASKILPEQTLGRGLRRMYPGDGEETVSVVGTEAFMDFVEKIRKEGVDLKYQTMGKGAVGATPLVVEVDRENEAKDIAALDIEIPVLTPRHNREFEHLKDLNLLKFHGAKVKYKELFEDAQREIVFRHVATGEVAYRTILDQAAAVDYENVLRYFARSAMQELRMVSGYDVLFGKIKEFVRDHLFERVVDLEDPNTLRNLAEIPATKVLHAALRDAINDVTIAESMRAEIQHIIELSKMRPVRTT